MSPKVRDLEVSLKSRTFGIRFYRRDSWFCTEVLLIALGKVALALKAEVSRDLLNSLEAKPLAFSGLSQQVPDSVQPNRPLQLKRCATEMFLASLEN